MSVPVATDAAQTLYIPTWKKTFENNRTRDLKIMEWVPIPAKMDGDGYTEIITHKDGPSHYAAWLAIVFVASRCKERGILMRDNGTPHDAASLARISQIPARTFTAAIPRLVAVGWLAYRSGTAVKPQEGAGWVRDWCGKDAVKPQEGADPSRERARCTESTESTERNTQQAGGEDLKPESAELLDEQFGELRQIAQRRGVLPGGTNDWAWAFQAWRVLDYQQKTLALTDALTRPADSPEMEKTLPQNYIKGRKWERPMPKALALKPSRREEARERFLNGNR